MPDNGVIAEKRAQEYLMTSNLNYIKTYIAQTTDDGSELVGIPFRSGQDAWATLRHIQSGKFFIGAYGGVLPWGMLDKLVAAGYVVENPDRELDAIYVQGATHILTGKGFRWAIQMATKMGQSESADLLKAAQAAARLRAEAEAEAEAAPVVEPVAVEVAPMSDAVASFVAEFEPVVAALETAVALADYVSVAKTLDASKLSLMRHRANVVSADDHPRSAALWERARTALRTFLADIAATPTLPALPPLLTWRRVEYLAECLLD
jgi:hypothetical protein